MGGDRSRIASELYITEWGEGEPVVLVHGSISTGEEMWGAQRPLAEAGFLLRVIDRRGYGASPAARGEDFRVDADDIAELLGKPSHLVGHSYGAIGALLAAARQPGTVRSLAVVEPPLFALAADHDPAAGRMLADLKRLWDEGEALGDREFLLGFLEAFGVASSGIPDAMLDALAEQGVGPLRHGRHPWEAELPSGELASARFPKVVFSGGHSPALEAICDVLAGYVGARRAVITGAGHDVPLTGAPFNEALLSLWRSPRVGR